MADIDVVKKNSRAWVWMLVLVVLAVIMWVAMSRSDAPQTGLRLQPEAHAAPQLSAA